MIKRNSIKSVKTQCIFLCEGEGVAVHVPLSTETYQQRRRGGNGARSLIKLKPIRKLYFILFKPGHVIKLIFKEQNIHEV